MRAVLVHLGNSLPEYLQICVEQIFVFHPGAHVYLIAQPDCQVPFQISNKGHFALVSTDDLPVSNLHRKFKEGVQLDAAFRGGFWVYAMERFFYLSSFMQKYGIQDVWHLEYDNLVYCDLTRIQTELDRLPFSLFLTLDNDERCIPGILYVREYGVLENLLQYYVARSMKRRQTDMRSLAGFRFHRKRLVSQLPVLPPWLLPARGGLKSPAGMSARQPRLYAMYGADQPVLFDAAALGQFLGGVDPRNQAGNTRGFVNESSVFRPDTVKILWTSDEQGRRYPYIAAPANQESLRIANLHIHSKQLLKFADPRIGGGEL